MIDTSQKRLRELVIGAVARGWCHQQNAHKVMDSELALAIVDEVLLVLTSEKESAQEPIGRLSVSLFRGHLENYSFEYTTSLPDGDYPLYLGPQKATEKENQTKIEPVLLSDEELEHAYFQGMWRQHDDNPAGLRAVETAVLKKNRIGMETTK